MVKPKLVEVPSTNLPSPGLRHGGRIPGSDASAFSLEVPDSLALPILIAAPHGGRDYPDRVIANMREPMWSMLRLEDRHVDTLAKSLADATGAPLLTAKAPRAMLDLNRASDDVDWSMIEHGGTGKLIPDRQNHRSRGGLGLIPRRLSGLGEIWRKPIAEHELRARVDGIHQPYHALLGKTLEQMRESWGAALLIDLHSMPPLKPTAAQPKPAEFVIGDRFGASCNGYIADRALRYFGGAGRRAAHNRPYSGGYVLDHHGAPRRNIHAIQIEVCRSLYLDARHDGLSPRFSAITRLLKGLVRDLACEVMSLGNSEHMREAAE